MGAFGNLGRNAARLSAAKTARNTRKTNELLAEQNRLLAAQQGLLAASSAAEATMNRDMAAAVRDLLGGGLVQDYYDQAAAPFVRAALRFADKQDRRAA